MHEEGILSKMSVSRNLAKPDYVIMGLICVIETEKMVSIEFFFSLPISFSDYKISPYSCGSSLTERKIFTRWSFLYNAISSGLILGLRPANERQRYIVMTSLIGWVQT